MSAGARILVPDQGKIVVSDHAENGGPGSIQ
jgi:hypothetical protein